MGLLVFSTEKSVRSRGKCVRLHFHWKTVSSRLLVFRLFILCVFFVSFFCLSHTSLVTWTASHSSTRMPLWSAYVVVEQVQSLPADNNSTTQMIESVPTDELTFFFFSMEEGYIISSLEPQPLLSVVMMILTNGTPDETLMKKKEKHDCSFVLLTFFFSSKHI